MRVVHDGLIKCNNMVNLLVSVNLKNILSRQLTTYIFKYILILSTYIKFFFLWTTSLRVSVLAVLAMTSS